MAQAQGPEFPSREPFLEGVPNLVTRPLLVWFRNIRQQVDATPTQAADPVSVSGSNAAIGVTPIPSDPLAPGLYRVSGYVRVTGAAVTSSSVAVVVTWVDGGVTCTLPLVAAVTGNTTASAGSGALMLRIDQASPISYSTTYASNGAGEMTYDLVLLLESLAA